MAKLPIITLPDPILRQRSATVERVDDDLRRFMDDMLDTMYAAPGIGLAAVQVGVPRRIVVIDASDEGEQDEKGEKTRNPICFVNPEIVARSEAMRVYEEGCLSIPDVRIEIERPAEVTVRYLDRDGKAQELAASGLLATALQHELDHLDGRLIIDFASRLKRDMIVRKFRKIARNENGE